eukprot:15469814-Alexandrium_andersonii.AAC.1
MVPRSLCTLLEPWGYDIPSKPGVSNAALRLQDLETHRITTRDGQITTPADDVHMPQRTRPFRLAMQVRETYIDKRRARM